MMAMKSASLAIAGYGGTQTRHHLFSSRVPHFQVSFNKLVCSFVRMPTLTCLNHSVTLHSRHVFASVTSEVAKYEICQ